MAISRHGAKQLVLVNAERLTSPPFLTTALSRNTVCASCRSRLLAHTRRNASSTATAIAEEPPPPPPTASRPSNPPVTATGPRKAFRLLASPVLTRPPLLTRDLTSFEKAFYLYQKRLNERLALPFSRYFYYKKGQPSDEEWKRKIRARKTPARDIGVYAAYGEEGWNDEVLVGDQTGEPERIREALIRDAEGKNIVDEETVGGEEKKGKAVTGAAKEGQEGQRKEMQQVEVERPMPRVTEADRTNDTRSLSRKLDRSLYLLLKNREGQWRFPEDRVYGRESLHQAAERIIVQSCGINMNTWIVGNHPVGHHVARFESPILAKISPNRLASKSATEFEQEEYGEKVFFMKARIMAGQADLSKNEYGAKEFQWLAKEEVKELVDPDYWWSVRNMLVER